MNNQKVTLWISKQTCRSKKRTRLFHKYVGGGERYMQVTRPWTKIGHSPNIWVHSETSRHTLGLEPVTFDLNERKEGARG